MGFMTLVLTLILVQYISFAMKVGGARQKHSIEAPAINGHPEFERYYRVHQNTLEQLIVFIPLYLVFPQMAEARGWMGYEMVSIAGVLWIIGRYIYASNYVKDPASRGKGFLISFLPTVLLLLGTLVLSVMSIIGIG
jgi:glutathione S-transferase